MPSTHPLISAPLTSGPLIVNPGDCDSRKRRQLGGPGLRAFLNIADAWNLSERQRLNLLGQPARSTYHGWVAKARNGEALALPLDALLRISAVLGVYKALVILFAADEQRVGWLRRPNSGLLFGGQAPLDLLANGAQDGIMLVRRHLDAWRGGLFAAPQPGFDDAAPAVTDADIVFV